MRAGGPAAPHSRLLCHGRGRLHAAPDARYPAPRTREVMIPLLPSINAFLNATAAVLLLCGYRLIRRKRIEAHRKVMTAAFVTSCLFLVCYIVYHAQVGSKHFPGTGAIRAVYLGILLTHTTL